MEQKKITLYTYATSPFGAKVYWALIYKGLDFEIVYVNPFDQREIGFTRQKVVPVLQIGSEWRLDSSPICLWLEELFPSPSFAGADEQEREAIKRADQWVTHNLIALGFRLMADKQMRIEAFKVGRKLVKTLRRTSGDVPWAFQFIWSTVLSRVGFIRRAAAMTDQSKSFYEVRQEMIDHLDETLTKSNYLAGTEHPSYADIAAFARIASATDLGTQLLISASTTPAIEAWFKRMLAAMPDTCEPPLIPGQGRFPLMAAG